MSDPPLTFRYQRRSKLGRKRQKLVVSPRDVRFLRLHWLEDGKRELAVDDAEIFFHHYVQRPGRFETEQTSEASYDDFMVAFSNRLRGLAPGARPERPTTVEQWIAHLGSALEQAEATSSRLSEEALALEGMCGTMTRHFYNRLCDFAGCRLLEIGCFKERAPPLRSMATRWLPSASMTGLNSGVGGPSTTRRCGGSLARARCG